MSEGPEGVVFGTIQLGDRMGLDPITYPNQVLALSKSQIETVDLLSEGPISSLVTGTWKFSGQFGEVGWRSTGEFTPYKIPTDFTGIQFLRSIYWNEVPVLNDDGQFNFSNVSVKFTEGKPNGDVIQVLSPFQTVSLSIGERLFANEPKYYRILNRDCRAAVINIKIPSLYTLLPLSEGNTYRDLVEYNIWYKPLFRNQNVSEYTPAKSTTPTERVYGKIIASNGYIRTTRVDFNGNVWNNPDFIGWEIKIERLTLEVTDSSSQNKTFVESITEIQGNIYTFPYSAMVRSLFDAEFFSSVPERAFDTELLKVKIPGNYNPILKTYSGLGFATTNSGWNGEFATGTYWSDNPAWCYYDLLTNKRYGLGKYIDTVNVDKFGLYEIGKYCDTLVYNGEGGLEPRFTCNLLINSREDASKVVNDMASIFRGLTYYARGTIFATQDKEIPEKEINTIFTNANVENGDFTYSSTSKKQRHSIAIVRYNDPKNFYRPAIEYVENFDAIRKYGVREVELTAFGCTSRGQAIRLGRWALLSDNIESEKLSFNAGLEASYLVPGDIFKVFDKHKKLKRYGGRTLEIKDIGDAVSNTGTKVVLDSTIDVESTVEYKISFVTPSYVYDPTVVSGLNSNDFSGIRRSFIQQFNFSGFQAEVSGSKMVVSLYTGLDYSGYLVTGNPVWMVELGDRYSTYTGSRYFANTSYDYYRVLNVKEEDINKFNVEAIQYNPQKYIEIESGLLFQKDIFKQSKIPATPHSLTFNVHDASQLASDFQEIQYSFLVDDYTNISNYKVYAKAGAFSDNNIPSSDYLIANLQPSINTQTYIAKSAADYYFRVYSYNMADDLHSASFAAGTVVTYKSSNRPIRRVIISSLQVADITGIYVGSSASNTTTSVALANSPATTFSTQFTWQVGNESPFNVSGDVRFRATVRAYSDSNRVPTNVILKEVTGITTNSWTFDVNDNINLAGGPYRDYQIAIEAHDDEGYTSAGHTVGSTSDNSWMQYPQGYDILSIVNPRPSGIEFLSNVNNQDYGNVIDSAGTSEDYGLVTDSVATSDDFGTLSETTLASNGSIDPNGGIVVSQTFEDDLVGGYLYTSTGQFNPIFTGTNGILTGIAEGRIKKSLFYYNSDTPYIYDPAACTNIKNQESGFVSVAFFDVLDKILIENNVEIHTGLYVSENGVFHKDSAIARLALGGGEYGAQTIKTTRMPTGSNFNVDWTSNVMLFSGTISGFTSVIYANPFEGSVINWRETS